MRHANVARWLLTAACWLLSVACSQQCEHLRQGICIAIVATATATATATAICGKQRVQLINRKLWQFVLNYANAMKLLLIRTSVKLLSPASWHQVTQTHTRTHTHTDALHLLCIFIYANIFGFTFSHCNFLNPDTHACCLVMWHVALSPLQHSPFFCDRAAKKKWAGNLQHLNGYVDVKAAKEPSCASCKFIRNAMDIHIYIYNKYVYIHVCILLIKVEWLVSLTLLFHYYFVRYYYFALQT